jgi:PAS domain S-box-containing protein
VLKWTSNDSEKDAIEASARELRHVFDHVPVRIWYKDDKNKILMLNAAAAESMNMPIEDIEGQDTYDLFPEMAKKYHEDDLAVINSGKPRLGIIEEYTPVDGPHGWVRTDKVPYTDPQSGERYVLVMAQDITAQLEADRKNQEHREHLELVLDSTLDGFWDWYIQDDYEYMSPNFWRMFGIDPETKKHHPSEWQDIIFQEDLDVALDNFAKHVATKGKHPYVQDVRYRHADGSTVTVLCRGRVIEWNENDQPIRMIGTHTDITELEAVKEKAAALSNRYQNTIDNSGIGVWEIRVGGPEPHVWFSDTIQELLGYSVDELNLDLMTAYSFVHPNDISRLQKPLESVGETTSSFYSEFRLEHKTQGYRWFMVSGRVTRTSHGNEKIIAGTLIDIDNEKQVRNKLELYTKRLIVANRDLDQFAYSASHDLRTPLRGIHHLASWIEEDLGDEASSDVKEHLGALRKRVERMELMLGDILAYSRIGIDSLHVEPVNITQLIDETIETMRPLPNVNINVDIDKAIPDITIPPINLQQIFQNLFSNAIKHHDKTERNIWVTSRAIDEGFEITVADDGPGIPEEYQEQVFGLFSTLKPKDAVEGSGLGLPIVRKMVDALGGDLRLVSEDGERGTKVIFTIPAELSV